ncbi:MAG: preprotein translocase subunit SecG [Verrucomicrobia bacterium Tous-C9LFEB]|nr:MAG: preprotein translocase subunit SecG [Verrucomicrobia bacterium Tous-C9LFEB]
MNWTNIAIGIFLSIHIVVCLLMVVIILMQRSKQEGLGAAFGGGITDSMFGAQTSQVLVRATVWLAILFFGLTIILARLYATRNNADNALQKALLAAPITAPATPAATTTPAPDTASPLTAPAATPAPAKK